MADETARQEITRLLEMMGDLPPMPAVASKVLEIASSEDARVSDVTRLISSDPGLATKVLSTCNSAYYGLPQRVKTLSRAVGLLGFKTVRNLVLVHSMPWKRSGTPSFADKTIWDHAGGAAVAARVIASIVGGYDPEEALLGGLMHDAGRLALNLIMPEKYEVVLLAVYNREGDSILLEQQHLGFDHAIAGELVLRKWDFPDNLVGIARNHHEPISQLDLPTLIVKAADEMCWILGQGVKAPDEPLATVSPALAKLGFSLAQVEELEERVNVGIEQSRDIFG
jgi:HD-like signal output (HDOD) protein